MGESGASLSTSTRASWACFSSKGGAVWYVERADRCVAQIWQVPQAVLAADRDVVLELGLLEQRQRERFYRGVERCSRWRAIAREPLEPTEQDRARSAGWDIDVSRVVLDA